MAEADFKIGRGRIYPIFRTQLRGPGKNSAGDPLVPDFTGGWTVKIRLYQDGVQLLERDAVFESVPDARVRYAWIVADTDRTPGLYELKVLTFDASGNPGSVYPVDSFNSVLIEPV